MNSINKPEYYIGLMSGTSADGIDLALVTFNSTGLPKLHASYYQAYSDEVASKITSLYGNTDNNSKNDELDRAFELDIQLAQLFAKAIKTLLQQTHLSAYEITAIGNHGQTIRHRPQVRYPFTLQIGCCQTLATLTNIRVIGQFRRKDMALGGQGAPLVPAFHEKVFSENAFNKDTINGGSSKQGNDIFVINIGGIANLTYLPATKNNTVIGYDTGSGNALMDDWFQRHNPKSEYNYDKNGDWAATGKINMVLLEQLLLDEYFQLAPPKSTGREYFNLPWLELKLAKANSISNPINNQDIQATLAALTATSIVNAITTHCSDESISTKVYLCGGGVHNATLKNLINQQLKIATTNYELLLTNQKGIDGDQLEAIAFAWLAFAYDKKLLSNMPAVTGASKSCTLGNVYLP